MVFVLCHDPPQHDVIADQETLTAQPEQVLVRNPSDFIVVMQQVPQQRIQQRAEHLNTRRPVNNEDIPTVANGIAALAGEATVPCHQLIQLLQ